ncbi:hypothetical protein HETIRDRAFT_246380, partial [Heterobasidion irregulare TC 32-1]
STVNEAEIAHFSRLSSLWWDERGEFGLLHKMNPARMQFIREKILESARDEGEAGEVWAEKAERDGKVLRGMDVLDVGCGGGILSEALTRLGAHTTAIDASESNIAIASLHAAADPSLSPRSASTTACGSLTYRHALAETLVQEPKRFDVVCSMEVLEHVDNPASFLMSCAELVKPGGHLFLSTIARTPLSYLLTILAAEHLLRLVEPGTHTHSKFVNPAELVDFFRSPLSSSLQHDGGEQHGQKIRPWISRTYEHGRPARTEAEVRGIVYLPWKGEWSLAPRVVGAWATECNYLFWVRKP